MAVKDWTQIVAMLTTLAVVALSAGCAGGAERAAKPRMITLESFSDPTHATPALAETNPQTAPASSTMPAASTPAATQPLLVARGPDVAASTAPISATTAPGTGRTVASPATPNLRAGERLVQPGDRIIVESVIGQVSGQPIYADEFLEPIAGRLRIIGESAKPGEFSQQAAQVILTELRQVVLSDLFLAEAEAALTPEQQMGLLAFVRRLKEDLISHSEGLETAAQARSQAEGKTLQETVQERRDAALISKQIQERIRPRVIVSWKDVEREYARQYAQFNPPARVTISRLRLDGTDPKEVAQIEEVKSQLAAGGDFTKIAEAIGPPASGTLGAMLMGPGGIADIEVNPKYKPALANMKVGDTTAPIDMGDSAVVWLHIDKIDQPPARTLFEVQRMLIREIEARRSAEEQEKYIDTLFKQGIFDNLRDMGQRALIVARLRYER